jgi:membrane-associated phospholipid phosphatase
MRGAQYPARMNRPLARAVSIAGHPMLVLPLAALALTLARGRYRTALWMAVGFTAFAALVMGYSAWQVGRGRWSHVDASDTGERRSLNRFLLLSLLASSVLAAVFSQPGELVLGLGLSAAMVLFAQLTARWWKLSLHVAFAVFAASLLLAGAAWWAGLIALAFAALVAWSRLALQRHTPRDLVAGLAVGAAAGIAFALVADRGTGMGHG